MSNELERELEELLGEDWEEALRNVEFSQETIYYFTMILEYEVWLESLPTTN